MTKSGPKKTARTPSMPISRIASGDARAERVSMNSAEPSFMTSTPGMNLRESSLGVDSVWMNMERAKKNYGLSVFSNKLREMVRRYIQSLGPVCLDKTDECRDVGLVNEGKRTVDTCLIDNAVLAAEVELLRYAAALLEAVGRSTDENILEDMVVVGWQLVLASQNLVYLSFVILAMTCAS